MLSINNITDGDLEDFSRSSSLSEYQRIATKSAIYPGRGTLFGLSYCAHKLAGEAGEFNEHFGKAMRDDGIFNSVLVQEHKDFGDLYHVRISPLTQERKDFLIKEIGDCLWYLSALCNELGVSLAHVAWINLCKLRDRTNRNKLQGSGDNR